MLPFFVIGVSRLVRAVSECLLVIAITLYQLVIGEIFPELAEAFVEAREIKLVQGLSSTLPEMVNGDSY